MKVGSFELGRTRSFRGAAASSRLARRRMSIGEDLESRQLLASLAPISGLNVPALQGYTLPLDGSGTTDPQTFTASSSNPDIAVSVVSTTFWTVGISYIDPITPSNSFTGTLTFALFGNLTPNTVKMISQFTSDDYYVNTGDFFSRIVSDFALTPYTVIQGGASQPQGDNAPSGQPNTPFANESLQPLALTGFDQLSMANSGGTDSNDTEFFINTGPLDSNLAYQFTVFGQLVSGAGTLEQIADIPVMPSTLTGEDSEPKNPITITSTSLSSSNSNGVVLIDTTQAHPGETAVVNVTATDSATTNITQASRSFTVTVGPYAGSTGAPNTPTINFKPYVSPVSVTTGTYSTAPIQLAAQSTFPVGPVPAPLYVISTRPAHGTLSDFDPATGTVDYTPTPGFMGTDSFQYYAISTGPNTSEPPAGSNEATVTITVNQGFVSLNLVEYGTNSKQKIDQQELIFSGPLKPALAKSKLAYRLIIPNRKGSYTGRGTTTIAIKKVVYDQTDWTVTLTPARPFAPSKKVALIVAGNGKHGLKDIFGHYIAGTGGVSGTDARWIV
jgi:cyclophilin family peptidyl-prolyl cis-trans isomerase